MNSLKSGIGSSFISLYVYLYVVQVLALMRIISVINFGNHLNAPKVLLEHVEERAYRQLFFSRIVRPTNSGGFSRQVAWFTDSQSPVQIVEVGSMKLDLHRLAVKIFQFCKGPVDPANGKRGSRLSVYLLTLMTGRLLRPLLTSTNKQFMKGCILRNRTKALTLGKNLNSFLGSACKSYRQYCRP